MPYVAYFSPFVPPEWISAHNLEPSWLSLDRQSASTREAARRGMCPCAAALVVKTTSDVAPEALVLSTGCDQMRYAAAFLDSMGKIPVFLFNVPSTWQTPQVRNLYREELSRLGRFLVQIGGREPTNRQISETVERYENRRKTALAMRLRMSARQWGDTLIRLRSDLAIELAPDDSGCSDDLVPLLLLGGPLLEEDGSFLRMVEESGGRIVVDGTETGERTLPGAVDRRRLESDPLDELVRIYFDTIPDVFRRPNTRLYDWLDQQREVHAVRGIILRRYPFCDHWHAELHRLRESSKLPVLDVDVVGGEDGERSRMHGRIEAFLEMLR